MKVLVLREKWDNRIVKAGTSAREIESTAAAVVQERILDGYWYDSTETDRAHLMIRQGRALEFLRSRNAYEYEGITVNELEELE